MYLWLEGVQFDWTIYDTNDIATIRGSSMLLEDLARRLDAEIGPLGAELHDFGASRAVFSFAEADEAKIRPAIENFVGSDLWRHFRLITGFGATVEAARADARLGQLREWSIPMPALHKVKKPDPLDMVRPATEKDIRPDNEVRFLSASVKRRRDNGSKQRPYGFGAGMVPPPSFEEIVEVPGRMPQVVRGKMAVVVADGIGIGDLAKCYASQRDFAEAVQDFRRRLSTSLAAWVEAPERREALIGKTKEKGGMPFPRLDVLVWGGDDMTFVLPASHLLDFLEFLIGAFDRPFADGKPAIPHRIGCIIAQHKAPIRQMRALASDAEWRLKQVRAQLLELEKKEGRDHEVRGQSLFSIDIFESAALPHASLGPYRAALYGDAGQASVDQRYDAEHAFTGAEFRRVRQFLTEDIGEGAGCIAISKLHDVLRRAEFNALAGSGKVIGEALAEHFDARGEGADKDNKRPHDHWTTGWTARKSLPVLLAQMAQLHPYSQVRA